MHALLAREHAEPADPAAAANEWNSERPMHCSRSVRLRVEIGQLDRPRVPVFRRSSEDTGGSVALVVQADRAEAAFVAVAVRVELDDRRVDLRERGSGLERRGQRVVEVYRRAKLSKLPVALPLLLRLSHGPTELLGELVEPRFERLHHGRDLCLGLAARLTP
jgi:hypothetical protein